MGMLVFHIHSASILILDCEQQELSLQLDEPVSCGHQGREKEEIPSLIFQRGKEDTVSY